MKEEKKEFQKAEVEIIIFDKNDDIVTTSSGQQTFNGGGQNPINPPSDNPPIPW